MKKYILRLALCAALLVCLIFLAKLIHDSMDGYVASKNPAPESTASPTTAPTDFLDPLIELTEPSNPTAPSNPTDPSNPSEPSTPTEPTTPTHPTTPTNPTNPTTPSTPGTSTTPPTTTKAPPSGQTAPATVFYNASGNAITIESFKDKPVVICFWDTRGKGNEKTLDMLSEQYAEFGDKIYFIPIYLTDGTPESRQAAEDFLATKSYPFPIYYDTDGACRASYKVTTYPTSFFLKKENHAIAYRKGNLSEKEFLYGLSFILPKESQ